MKIHLKGRLTATFQRLVLGRERLRWILLAVLGAVYQSLEDKLAPQSFEGQAWE